MARRPANLDAPFIEVNGRRIGPGEPTYVIAEMSGNHNGSYDRALQILEACADAGVDAVKLQTYTADTLTINSDAEIFHIGGDNTWAARLLFFEYSMRKPRSCPEALRKGLQKARFAPSDRTQVLGFFHQNEA